MRSLITLLAAVTLPLSANATKYTFSVTPDNGGSPIVINGEIDYNKVLPKEAGYTFKSDANAEMVAVLNGLLQEFGKCLLSHDK